MLRRLPLFLDSWEPSLKLAGQSKVDDWEQHPIHQLGNARALHCGRHFFNLVFLFLLSMRKAVVSALLYSRSDSTSRERCGLAFSLDECLWVIECKLGTSYPVGYFVDFVIDFSEFCSFPVIGPGRRKAKLFPEFPLTWWWLEASFSLGKIHYPCCSHYANNVNFILGYTGSSRASRPSQRKENSPWGSPRLLWHGLHPTLSPSMPWPHCSSLSQALSASVLASFIC